MRPVPAPARRAPTPCRRTPPRRSVDRGGPSRRRCAGAAHVRARLAAAPNGPGGRHPPAPRRVPVARGDPASATSAATGDRDTGTATRSRPSFAGEPRRPLLEEGGDALGAVGGGRDQEVEVGFEPERVGEGEVAPTLHRVARRCLRAGRTARELRRDLLGMRTRIVGQQREPAALERAARRSRRPRRACAAPAPRRRRG